MPTGCINTNRNIPKLSENGGYCEVSRWCYRQYKSAVSDLKEALSLSPGHREIQRLLARVEDELKASRHDDSNSQTTIQLDPVPETGSRTCGIPDTVPGSICTDGSSFDGIEQNDQNAA